MKTYDEMSDADIPEDASISNPASSPIRLLGSNSTFEDLQARALPRKRRQDDDDEPLPDDDPSPPPPPPPPPPPISTPDLAIQFPFCLKTLADVDEDRNSSIPSAGRLDRRPTCGRLASTKRLSRSASGSARASERDNAARDRGLRRLNIVGRGEVFSIFHQRVA